MENKINRLLQQGDFSLGFAREIERIEDFVNLNKGKPKDNVVEGIQYILLALTKKFYSVAICEEIYSLINN